MSGMKLGHPCGNRTDIITRSPLSFYRFFWIHRIPLKISLWILSCWFQMKFIIFNDQDWCYVDFFILFPKILIYFVHKLYTVHPLKVNNKLKKKINYWSRREKLKFGDHYLFWNSQGFPKLFEGLLREIIQRLEFTFGQELPWFLGASFIAK